MNIKIRTYRDPDEKNIRDIATSTAKGFPRSNLQVVADLLTGYYLNYEPEHFLVSEVEGRVVGYLSGCFNTSRSRWIKATRVIPRAVLKALFRGEVGHPQIRYLGSFIYVTLRGGTSSSAPSGYPAHFHINVKDGWRGEGIGTKLAKRFLSTLKEAGIGGVHVRVRQDKGKAGGFFRSLGFSRDHAYPTLVAIEGEIHTSRSIIYTKEL